MSSLNMQYTDKVLEHFMSPKNAGEIADADGVGTIGSEECGDMIRVWIKVTNQHLVDIKYKVFGCPAAIAACSMMTELAMGKHIKDAYELTDAQVAEALGGLPVQKYHCSNLAASALHKAITDFEKSVQSNLITITTLVDDGVAEGFQPEHGLSFWIEYDNKRVLFDTGQSNILLKNAEQLDIKLAETNAIVISHGHYDHTGGLSAVLDMAPEATIYLHPEALKPKFGRKRNKARAIGIPDSARDIIRFWSDNGKVVLTEKPTEVFQGVFVTSRIPRITDFEDVCSSFFVDSDCRKPDTLPDDQALILNSPKGLVVLLGCAHAGVVNTLHYAAKLSGEKHIYAVMGGMHLLNASSKQIEKTIDAFKQYGVQKIGLSHCTGSNATKKFKSAFSGQCFICSAGSQVGL